MNTRPLSQQIEPNKATSTGDASASAASESARLQGSRAQAEPLSDWSKTLSLIEAVATTKDQNQAITALVNYAASQFPTSSIRCGIGTARLRRFFDSRLGWLGPASDLFQQASDNWDEDAATLSTRPALPTELASKKQEAQIESIRLNIDEDVGLGRCVLWIDDGQINAADRSWLRRTLPSLRAIIWQRSGGLATQLVRWLSSGGMTMRIYVGLAALLVTLLAIWPVSYRVRCTTFVRPKHSRIVAAPFDATLEASHVQPGDRVNAGDVLISLDGRPLRLELETVEAQIGQVLKERDISMVGGRIAEAQQARLRIRELNRHRDLLVSRLDRLSVTSPIDGIVVLGDLTRSIGAPLETGQAVFEVAPLQEMVVELEIPEYEIGYVSKGSVARVRLTAADGDPIEQPIDAVYPSAELRDDQNVFVAHINVDNRSGKLRPGMRGDAIVYGPIRPWLWSLARSGWEKTLWWIGY